jgi:photosystem II stability/assembly factor-like uncharacterized protein
MTLVLAVGTRKGLFLAHSSNGAEWSVDGPQYLMREIAAVGFVDPPDGAGGADGAAPRLLVGVRSEHWGPTVAHSDDLGQTWVESERGAVRFPEGTDAALARVWQLQADPGRPTRVWAGCEPTSLWVSDDSGESFGLVRGLWDHPHRPTWEPGFGGAAVHTVVPDATDGDRVLVAMSAGGVYVTSDGGTSWAPSNSGISAYFLPDPNPEYGQCVHKVAADASGAAVLYAQNHHGVYRSDDAGATWASIADGLPSDFGFVMLAHPTRPGTVWVLPLEADARRVPPKGRLRLHRSRDGGRSWSEVGDGLPDQAWTAVLRDAACITGRDDDAAPLVAFGTRDGCVYASTDEGESFTQVAAHLPDVLSLRAAVVP